MGVGGSLSRGDTSDGWKDREPAKQGDRCVYSGEGSGQVVFGTFMLLKCCMEPDELDRERRETSLKRFAGDRGGRSVRSLDFIRRTMWM